jgi:hypothetical protein
MAGNRTEWTAGNGAGFTWTSAFASGDLTSLADSKCVLSSASAVANQSNLDMYMDISVKVTVSSNTPRLGAYIGIWLAILNQDGSTYGDNQLTAGTQTTYTPPWAPLALIPLANQAMTTMEGQATGLIIPPQSFLLICYNYTSVTFSSTSGNNLVKINTYNVYLNN